MGTRLKALFAAFALGLLATPACAQNSAPTLDDAIAGYESAAHQSFQGIPTDWSSHHVLYSMPEAGSDAEYKVQQDPGYWMQQIRRNSPESDASIAASDSSAKKAKKKKKKIKLVRDWNVPLGVSGNLSAGNYPAKFAFGTTTASCTDFVVYPTGLAAVSGGQADIVAYSNLYSGTCSGTVPSVAWAYNTGVGAKVVTSPVLASDGVQVAFIQTTGTTASLVLLKSSSTVSVGTITAATAPLSVSFANYRACPAPCMTVNALNGSPNDTTSSPFYDFASDSIYVGDAAGKLHKFSGVFNGSPAEVTSGFPETLGTTALTSPVFDNGTSKKVFVTDAGGFLYSVPAAGGSKITSAQVGFGTPGTVDGPFVDPNTEKVYVFVGDDAATAGGVFQFAAAFAANNGGIEETLGSANTGSFIYDGDFDNTYFTGAGTTGHLYVCGYHSGGTQPRLYQITMNAGFTGGVITYDTPSGGTANCSPVTEFNVDATHDWIFLSLTANGTGTGCTGACIYNYNVHTTTASAATAGLGSAGGTSGIVIDNLSAAAGASQVYYSALANKAATTINHTGGYAPGATSFVVTSGTGIANGDYLIIGSEIILVTGGGGTTTLAVTRAQYGTTAGTILNGAAVTDNGAAVQTSQSVL
jgi:hypothetical protein